MKEELTVLMSVKNGQPFLNEAIESILNQTFRDFKFLILDNNSTDKTRDIIESYCDPRINLIKLPVDIGQTKALNKGLSVINGGIVARMDADDVSEPERLFMQYEYLQAHPDVGLIGSSGYMINEKGNVLFSIKHEEIHERIVNSFVLGNQFIHSSVMYRKESIIKTGCYSENYILYQDLDLWIKMARNYKVANLPDMLIKVRMHPNQESRDDKRRNIMLNENLKLTNNMLKLDGVNENTHIAIKLRICGIHIFKKEIKKAVSQFVKLIINYNFKVFINIYVWKKLILVFYRNKVNLVKH